MSDWNFKKFIFTFATSSVDAMVRKAFNAIKFWLDGFIDAFDSLGDAFDNHWERHEFDGDDEGTVESLATDVDDEGQTLRSAGGREVEMTNRLTVGAADMDLTLLLGNTGTNGCAIHDGFPVVKRTDVKFEECYTMPLINGDMEEDNSGVPRYWTEVVVTAGITASQNSDIDYVYKGSHSWLMQIDIAPT